MAHSRKKVLLIDIDDPRRGTRVQLLTAAGCDVEVRRDSEAAERLNDEVDFDLVIVAIHRSSDEAAHYSDRLTEKNPALPILLLVDNGAFVPRGTLSRCIPTGDPATLMKEVARMLTGAEQIRELSVDAD